MMLSIIEQSLSLVVFLWIQQKLQSSHEHTWHKCMVLLDWIWRGIGSLCRHSSFLRLYNGSSWIGIEIVGHYEYLVVDGSYCEYFSFLWTVAFTVLDLNALSRCLSYYQLNKEKSFILILGHVARFPLCLAFHWVTNDRLNRFLLYKLLTLCLFYLFVGWH